MATLPVLAKIKCAYWLVRCEDENGKHYRQYLAADNTAPSAHKIFRSLTRLGIKSCTIDFVECTQAEYDELFAEDLLH